MTNLNDEVVAAAELVVGAAIKELLSTTKRGAVIGVAPAGAGKSYAIASAVLAARKDKRRVAVATPTNDQAYALVKDIAHRTKENVCFVPASGRSLPDEYRSRNTVEREAKDANAESIIVGTLNKLGDAHARGSLRPVDVLLVDEAYQANAVHYYGVGDLAQRHLLMGDSGQLAPFTTAPEGDRWRGLDEDPLLTAVEVLRRNHPSSGIHQLPITRRLDPRAVEIARAFYPRHSFEAAVLPGVRRLKLSAASGSRKMKNTDEALEIAGDRGWAHIELPASAVVTNDPEIVATIVGVAKRLFAREPTVRCERRTTAAALREQDVAVAVSHNDQRTAVRTALDAAGMSDVVVSTANKLQGLTFEVVIAWHPLAGLDDVDEFHLDPGRLCVMLTRHRHACIVVGRAGDRDLVEGIPPATPSYVGWDPNPALDGWFVHEGVFRALERYRVAG